MALYLVVHHRGDRDQPWQGNDWIDDDRLRAIETTREIGQRCSEAQQLEETVYFHRCGWNDNPPTICCSAKVTRIEDIDKRTSFVEFAGIEPTQAVPPLQPRRGQNYYEADAP